jgi:hypothetical protein
VEEVMARATIPTRWASGFAQGSAILVVLGLMYIVFSSRIALEALNELSKHF